MSFKKDFVWGVATAAYQIEGGAFDDGKGLNDWDQGCIDGGYVFENHTGNVACDHYHKFKEDVALMAKLGVKNYRFSVSWSRILPEGVGKVNKDGIKFYNELIDELLSHGITPWMTLFHWDYPEALIRRGGLLNDQSPFWFEEYAKVIAENFGDRVKNFMTINEPHCFVGLGYYEGVHAPFWKLPIRDVLVAAKNTLLSSGLACKVLKKYVADCRVGTAQVVSPGIPKDETDIESAREWMFSNHNGVYSVNLWCDPMVFGKLPEEFAPWLKKYGFDPSEEELQMMKAPFDFIGMNTYMGDMVERVDGKIGIAPPTVGYRKTDMRWNVLPKALYYGAKFMYERYNLPIYVTENGVALTEWVDENGQVNDYSRIDFIKTYLRQLKKASDEGVEIDGYFYWSFMDNFEWAEGYSKRFGLVHIDYETLVRTPKLSFSYYKSAIESNGEVLDK